MELGPQNHDRDGLSVPNSIMAVYMDPRDNTPPALSPLWTLKEPYNGTLNPKSLNTKP